MDATQFVIDPARIDELPQSPADLVLCFGPRHALQLAAEAGLARRFGGARVVGCSTAGQIAGESIFDDWLSISALRFEDSSIAIALVPIAGVDDSRAAGQRLMEQLPNQGLRHVLVISEGLHVNGSQLALGIDDALPEGVFASGGLAVDERLTRTELLLDEQLHTGAVVAIGLYGERLNIGFGSVGGWDPFGPKRRITKARGNLLYELDGQSALALYQRYLGEQHSQQLPASALLFPLLVEEHANGGVVRTVLAINEQQQSMTFAGDMPEGALARLMRANLDRLIDGAAIAAEEAYNHEYTRPDFALLISGLGRRMVLRGRCVEELEAVSEALGPGTVMGGFYSYGELCPLFDDACNLHNQTMTITTLSESDDG